jgi:Family of unknown function (DUF5701)/NAD dependent epimerase/dehydratase family
MRVFVAGAARGHRNQLVPELIDAGHELIGTSRSPANAKRVRALGAKPIALDLLDARAVRKAVLASDPEAIVHQATALAELRDLKHFDRSFAQTNRLRTEAPTRCWPPRPALRVLVRRITGRGREKAPPPATSGDNGVPPMVEVATMTFEEQVRTLLQRGLVDDEAAFRKMLEPARPVEPMARSVLTVSREVVPVAVAAARVERRGRPVVLGQIALNDLDTFLPIDAVKLPDAPAYLAVEVDLGAGSRNVRPEDALRDIEVGRSPLTLDEGIALVLQQPEAIARNWGFSMAGSRRGDQRVPAFWLSECRPKLGWCWDRNPHTWLGTASCSRRTAGA